MTEEKFNEFMAKYVVENTNAAFENFRYFAATVNAINGIVPNFRIYEIPQIPHIWYAVKEIKKLRPKMEFSDEVKEFVRIASNEAGYLVYPPELDIYSEYEEVAKNLSKEGPFPLGETTEEIQAAKLLEIYNYLNRMESNANE